ncbi:HD-GYP domain-containing protein [Candidatus Atribacteria bacterium MT.SAG.1]|nr:HD-GYP domain-containing protein [Candidatus Atribacteria bacterium MT.SAG.1]
MSIKLKVYIGAITGLAIALFIYLAPSLPLTTDMWRVLTFFIILSTIAEFIPVDLPIGGRVTIGFPIDFMVILIYGPAFAVCITFLGEILGELFSRKSIWYKTLFNASQYALSAGIAGMVYQGLGGVVDAVDLSNYIIPAAICAVVYYLINSNLFMIVISIAEEVSILSVWKSRIRGIIATYIALAPIGFIMAMVYATIGIWGIILFFFPLILARRSFELYTKMRKVYLDTIRALAAAIDAKDPYTKGHSERVAETSVALAQELNLSGRDIENIEYTALLHDIGKIGIADNILGKKSSLTNKEFAIIKEHTIMGAKIIEPVDFLKDSYEAIYHHHERHNGKGYPDGIKSEDIPILARIIAVADAYDAMGSDRPYRKKLNKDKILRELKDQSGKQFDPEVVKAFISVLKREREE